MKMLIMSLLIHGAVLFYAPFENLKKPTPHIESSSQVIHLSFKLDESEVIELKKKIDVLKSLKKIQKKESKKPTKIKKSKVNSSTREKVSKAQGEELINKYFLELRKFIEEKKYYPKMALRMRQAGSVEICLEIDQDGNFHQVHIKSASPYASLNKAALSLVEEISKFKPLPVSFGRKITLNIPLKYALNN